MRDTNKIGGYLYNPMFRGYLHQSYTGPMEVVNDEMDVHEVLDALTEAVENGKLTRDGWPEELFASEKDLAAFLERLEGEYDEIFRIVDRWWCALSDLLNRPDEEMFITGSHVARAFEEELADLKTRRAEAEAVTKKAKAKKLKKAA